MTIRKENQLQAFFLWRGEEIREDFVFSCDNMKYQQRDSTFDFISQHFLQPPSLSPIRPSIAKHENHILL